MWLPLFIVLSDKRGCLNMTANYKECHLCQEKTETVTEDRLEIIKSYPEVMYQVEDDDELQKLREKVKIILKNGICDDELKKRYMEELREAKLRAARLQDIRISEEHKKNTIIERASRTDEDRTIDDPKEYTRKKPTRAPRSKRKRIYRPSRITKAALKKRQQRALRTEEEKKLDNQKQALRARLIRASRTEEERRLDNEKQALRTRRSRASRTEEQRKLDNQKQALRKRIIRASRTEDQRKLDNQKQALKKRIIRASRTEEQRKLDNQ